MDVVGYYLSKGTMTQNCRAVSAAVVYDCPMTGDFFIIDIHHSILMDNIHNNTLCPMKMRIYDVKVNDITKYLTDNSTDQTHSIVIHEKGKTLLIPLHLHGFTYYFISRKLTM